MPAGPPDYFLPETGAVLTHLTVEAVVPADSRTLSSAMNIRVTDVRAAYQRWRSRGAEFLTEPKDHELETRCYLRDPDGYLIEVGQATGILDQMRRGHPR